LDAGSASGGSVMVEEFVSCSVRMQNASNEKNELCEECNRSDYGKFGVPKSFFILFHYRYLTKDDRLANPIPK
jgi:hypothetical protein